MASLEFGDLGDLSQNDPLPRILYVVTTERVKAGKPPIVLKNPVWSDYLYIQEPGKKHLYSKSKCFQSLELATKRVVQLVENEIQIVTRIQNERIKKLRNARTATREMLGKAAIE